MRVFAAWLLAAVLLASAGAALGRLAFPPPDFQETRHQLPVTQHPDPHRALLPDSRLPDGQPHAALYDALQYVDLLALAAALALGAVFSLVVRSRAALLILSGACLAYFGFWRMGCVCPVGATQNVALGLAGGSYVVPLTVAAFFILPLAAALFVGRAFCSGVCPLGAIQDLVLIRPLTVPRWIETPLSVLPWLYLVSAIVMAVLGGTFLICQYDPFVSFFRLNGPAPVIALGAAALVIAMFVGRPYCRFVCPYGALLGCASRLAPARVRITTAQCVRCRHCRNACPFGAIRGPQEPRPASRAALAGALAAGVAVVALGILAGRGLAVPMAMSNPDVRTAIIVEAQDLQPVDPPPGEALAFAATGRNPQALHDLAALTIERFRVGGMVIGGVVAAVIAIKLITLCFRRRRRGYEPDRAACLSCGRCFDACPVSESRRTGRPLSVVLARRRGAPPEPQEAAP